MRSADAHRRPIAPTKAALAAAVAALLATLLAGCGSAPPRGDEATTGSVSADAQAHRAAASQSAAPDSAVTIAAVRTGADAAGKPLSASDAKTASAGASQAASSPAASASAPRVALPPVDPAVQRAFDNARRAMAAGRIDEAERGFKALAQSHPELGGPHANLGVIERNAGRLAQSQAALERAVEASPEQAVYWNQLGITYRQQGAFAKAREAYEKAMALDASYAAPCLNLAILADLYLGQRAEALQLYERYLRVANGPDATVAKWVADLKNRKPAQQVGLAAQKKEVQ